MRLVDEHQRRRRQVVDERRRRLARLAARQVARVVLDALAVADLGHHLEVEARPLLDALRLDQLHLADEEVLLLVQLDLDLVDRGEHLLPPRHVVRRGEHREARDLLLQVPGQRVEELQRLDLVVEERDADRILGVLRRKDVEDVAAHAEHAALELDVVARVLHLRQPLDRVALRHAVALLQVQDHAVVLGRVADAVDRGHRRDDHAVRPLEDRLGRGQAHLLDVLVDRAVLLDVEVARRDVRLRLVVVVVRHEVLDRVVREELAELGVELRGERLVRRDHDRGPSGARDHVGHRERLARPRDAQQRLVREPVGEALDELRDRLRLVARRLERHVQFVGAVGIGDVRHGLGRASEGQPAIVLPSLRPARRLGRSRAADSAANGAAPRNWGRTRSPDAGRAADSLRRSAVLRV